MELEDMKTIQVYDNEGNKKDMEVLFTYVNDERGTNYIFFYDPEDPENVIPMRYVKVNDEEFSLEDIDDDEEYEEVEEVFNAYMDDPKIQEAKK